MKILLASLLLASAAFARDDKPAQPGGGGAKPAKSAVENILKGDYLEARTCDVWTGPCFANSETELAGREATLAWKFTSGKWAGVDLEGVSAVLIIEAKGTLGDKYHSPLPVRDVLLLDQKASDAQLEAMRAFIRAQLGDLAGNVVEERLVPIELSVGCCEKKGCAKLTAGEVARLSTRCLGETDDICGHEETFYPPLVALKDSLPAYTIESGVKGTLLAHEWTDRDSRSAFLGHFEARSLAPALAVDPEGIRAK
jgi:hypothetical protein